MKKGKHEGKWRWRWEKDELILYICLALGGLLGLAVGIVYLQRNPETEPRYTWITSGILWWYTAAGGYLAYCLFEFIRGLSRKH